MMQKFPLPLQSTFERLKSWWFTNMLCIIVLCQIEDSERSAGADTGQGLTLAGNQRR